jgi:hypothetical protein
VICEEQSLGVGVMMMTIQHLVMMFLPQVVVVVVLVGWMKLKRVMTFFVFLKSVWMTRCENGIMPTLSICQLSNRN